MKQKIFTILFLFAVLNLQAQTDNYRKELQNLADISQLPIYRAGDIEQLSSYDRTGGNDDGFSGKYSFIRKEAEGLVIAELKGPGVIYRIWTPTPDADTIKFYFDGEKTARISIPFIDLFTGNSYPFVSPLCGNDIGGYYCYLPVPYEKSLKIVYTGKTFRFHQTEYRSLSEKEKMNSFSVEKLVNYTDLFEKIAAVWSKKFSPLESYGANLKSKKINLTLKPGIEANIFQLNTGGRIAGIELGAGSDLLQAYRKVMLTARWDDDLKQALDLPLHDFFGFAFGKPAMQSVMLGSDKNKLYSYLPMPFDRSAQINLKYNKLNANDPDELIISGTVYYTEEKRDEKNEGKFYAQSRREYNIPQAVPYLISDIKGKGHYIGTVLIAQGLEDGHTMFFEGDDITTIDGKMHMHGTGSEDYFNGGYYAVLDKWDRGMSLPIHGSLLYDLMTSRTGGYRFYLTDKMNFEKSFNLTIEHFPEDKTNVKADYTSIGFFYAENPQYENTEINIDNKVTAISHREKLTAQGMLISLYWHASASYEDPAIVFASKKSDEWYANIDIDAVPVARISLPALDNGRYKLYVEIGKTENGSPFSLWQGTKQISDWISTNIETPVNEGKPVFAGEIDITEELKTITLRRKKEADASVRVYNFLFEKINNSEK